MLQMCMFMENKRRAALRGFSEPRAAARNRNTQLSGVAVYVKLRLQESNF